MSEHVLDDRTVIVHGLALDDRGKSLLRSAGGALIWCPTSNMFLFGRTHGREVIQQLSRVALGSDSPLTAQGDLLDEIRFASAEIKVPASELYSLVTTRPADVLRLKNGEGTLRIGAFADLIAVRSAGRSPAQTLSGLSYRDVELVLIDGRVHLASPQILQRLPRHISSELSPLEIEGNVRWIRAPLSHLFSEAQAHLGNTLKLGGRPIRYGSAA